MFDVFANENHWKFPFYKSVYKISLQKGAEPQETRTPSDSSVASREPSSGYSTGLPSSASSTSSQHQQAALPAGSQITDPGAVGPPLNSSATAATATSMVGQPAVLPPRKLSFKTPGMSTASFSSGSSPGCVIGDGSGGGIGVPVFALHPRGTYYIPMRVEWSLVSFTSRTIHIKPAVH